MKTMISALILFAALHVVAQPSARLYAVTFYDRQFLTIDTNSGAGTLITNLPASPLDIAVRGGKLWVLASATDVERLLNIDAWTGALLAQKSFTSSISGGEGAMDFATDGTAFAVKVLQSTGTLFRIDMALTNVTPVGGQSPSLDGLAFDTNGVLYGLSQNAGGFGLYTMNTNTGSTTLVGSLGVSFPSTGGAVAGLAFAPDGSLFAAAGNPTESRFYRVNKSSGAATLIGPIGFGGVSGIRFFVPPPGPLEITRTGSEVRISWPSARGGVLQTSGTITGAWSVATVPLTTNGAEVFTLVPTDHNQAYFRLGL